MLTPEQVAARRAGLGGSDAAAALGLSPWKTQLELYLEKTGQAPEAEPSEAMQWGLRLESAVARAAGERLGARLRRRRVTLARRERPWMLAHVDREVVGRKAILEIKTAARRDGEWGEEGSDRVPRHYLCQAAHYLAVKRWETCWLAVLFLAERRLALYEIRRDADLEAALVAAESRFWHDRVLARVPPDPRDAADARRRWKVSRDGAAEADERTLESLRDLRRTRAELRSLEARRDELERAAMQRMGEASELVHPATGETLATWRASARRSVDVKALRRERPDVAAEFEVAAPVRRFLLKETT